MLEYNLIRRGLSELQQLVFFSARGRETRNPAALGFSLLQEGGDKGSLLPSVVLIKPHADCAVAFAGLHDHPWPLDRANTDNVTRFEISHSSKPPISLVTGICVSRTHAQE